MTGRVHPINGHFAGQPLKAIEPARFKIWRRLDHRQICRQCCYGYGVNGAVCAENLIRVERDRHLTIASERLSWRLIGLLCLFLALLTAQFKSKSRLERRTRRSDIS